MGSFSGDVCFGGDYFSAFHKNFHKVLWKKLSTCHWDNFEEKAFFFEKIYNFLWSFTDKEQIFLALWQIYATWLSQLPSTCPWEHFEEKQSFKTIVLLSQFWTMSEFFLPSGESFWQGSQNCFLRVHGNASGIENVFFCESLFTFLSSRIARKSFTSMLKKDFGLLSILFRQDCQNCLLFVLKNCLSESFFSEKNFLLTFSETEWKIFGQLSNFFGRLWNSAKFFSFLANFWARVVISAVLVSTETFWDNYFSEKFLPIFSDNDRKFFGQLSKNFRQGYQKCIVLVQTNFLRRPNRNGYIFNNNFDFDEKVSGLIRNVVQGFAKSRLYISGGKIWETKDFIQRIINFHIIVALGTKIYCISSKFFWEERQSALCKTLGREWKRVFILWKNTFIYYIFRTNSEVHQPSGKLFLQCCWKSSVRVHRNNLR